MRHTASYLRLLHITYACIWLISLLLRLVAGTVRILFGLLFEIEQRNEELGSHRGLDRTFSCFPATCGKLSVWGTLP
jgi:hypothetical protein